MEINNHFSILKTILKRLKDQKSLEDSDILFWKKHRNTKSTENYSYFRCLGLPFQISKSQIVEKLIEPERYNIQSYGLSLIIQHGKFSGKAVLQVPSIFTETIMKKNRMFIGKRYIQLIQVNQEEYESYKLKEERQRDHQSRDPFSRTERRKKSQSSSSP